SMYWEPVRVMEVLCSSRCGLGNRDGGLEVVVIAAVEDERLRRFVADAEPDDLADEDRVALGGDLLDQRAVEERDGVLERRRVPRRPEVEPFGVQALVGVRLRAVLRDVTLRRVEDVHPEPSGCDDRGPRARLPVDADE